MRGSWYTLKDMKCNVWAAGTCISNVQLVKVNQKIRGGIILGLIMLHQLQKILNVNVHGHWIKTLLLAVRCGNWSQIHPQEACIYNLLKQNTSFYPKARKALRRIRLDGISKRNNYSKST